MICQKQGSYHIMSKLKNKYIDMIQNLHAYIYLNFKQVDLLMLTLVSLLIPLDLKMTRSFKTSINFKQLKKYLINR